MRNQHNVRTIHDRKPARDGLHQLRDFALPAIANGGRVNFNRTPQAHTQGAPTAHGAGAAGLVKRQPSTTATSDFEKKGRRRPKARGSWGRKPAATGDRRIYGRHLNRRRAGLKGPTLTIAGTPTTPGGKLKIGSVPGVMPERPGADAALPTVTVANYSQLALLRTHQNAHHANGGGRLISSTSRRDCDKAGQRVRALRRS